MLVSLYFSFVRSELVTSCEAGTSITSNKRTFQKAWGNFPEENAVVGQDLTVESDTKLAPVNIVEFVFSCDARGSCLPHQNGS